MGVWHPDLPVQAAPQPPNQYTETELKLIHNMRRRNPSLGMVELWHRLRQRGYIRRPESLFQVISNWG